MSPENEDSALDKPIDAEDGNVVAYAPQTGCCWFTGPVEAWTVSWMVSMRGVESCQIFFWIMKGDVLLKDNNRFLG